MLCNLHILNDAEGNPIPRTPIVVENAWVESEEELVRLTGSDDFVPSNLSEDQRQLYLPHYKLISTGVKIIGFGCRGARRIEWMLYPPTGNPPDRPGGEE